MSRTLLLALTSICILAAVAGSGDAAEWQWAVDREGGKGRTFLWIPPHCKHARGVIMGQQVILEARFFDDPVIRAAAEKEDLAMVFNVPAIFGYESFDPTLDGDQKLKSLMDQLATVSGYAELAQAPILTIGHSGGAIFAWNLAWWHPERFGSDRSAQVQGHGKETTNAEHRLRSRAEHHRPVRNLGRIRTHPGMALAVVPGFAAGNARDSEVRVCERAGWAGVYALWVG
jgi:hypothetical protein